MPVAGETSSAVAPKEIMASAGTGSAGVGQREGGRRCGGAGASTGAGVGREAYSALRRRYSPRAFSRSAVPCSRAVGLSMPSRNAPCSV